MKSNNAKQGLGKRESTLTEIIVNILVAMLPVAYIIKRGYEGTIFTDFTAILFYCATFLVVAMLTINKAKFAFIRFDFLTLMFTFWVLIGVFYSPYEGLGFIKFLKFLFFGVSIIYIIRVVVKKSRQINRILDIYSIIVFFISICFIVYYCRSGLHTRSSYLNNAAISFGYSVGFGILYLINRIFSSKKESTLYKFYLIVFLCVELYALLLNATRGALASIVIAFILFIPFYHKQNRKMFYTVLSFSSLLGIYLFVNLHKFSSIPIIQRYLYVGKDLSLIYRFEMWNQAIQDFLKSPIWGIGTAGFAVKIGGIFQTNNIYPHNIILEVGAENGFVGLILLFYVIYEFIKLYKNKVNYQNTLLAQLVTFSFIGNMVSFSYSINKLFYFSIGLFTVNILLERRKNQNEKSSFTN